MTLQEIITQIESSEFQANISALSGFQTVLNAFRQTESLQKLVDLLRDNPKNQQSILGYIESKIPDYQAAYAHPHDISLAALLYVLEKVETSVNLEMLITEILSKTEFFWARYMAQKIIHEKLQKDPS